jgi:zinc protease
MAGLLLVLALLAPPGVAAPRKAARPPVAAPPASAAPAAIRPAASGLPGAATLFDPRSDVPLDPGWRFVQLPNGMRALLRHNATPSGLVLVRMEVAAGSLDEKDDERGFAHFVEHMAFQGSTHVPTGEMIHLLERKGLAFGADTNAFTSFEQTAYVLDLPRNDPALLDTALMLMRETASELLFDPAQIARERGVILAEKRDRNTFQYREMEDRLGFVARGSRYARRLPIGTDTALAGASADTLRAFWQRTYAPARTTLVVVGDIDVERTAQAIAARFGDWRAGTADRAALAPPLPARPSPHQPSPGPFRTRDSGRESLYLDPAQAERVTISRNAPWLDEVDTTAQRREDMLRRIGYGVVNRRLQRLAHRADPPFRDAGFGTSDVFRIGRTTNLVVDSLDGQWPRALAAAAAEYRRALTYGFTQSEIAEQVANVHIAAEHAAASSQTRPSAALMGAAFSLVRGGGVPGNPGQALARLKAFIPSITPDAVLAALRREAVPLDPTYGGPLIRFQGKIAPEGGAKTLRKAWNQAMREPLGQAGVDATGGFEYGDFGAPGTISSDTREPRLGIREVRFANGVRLNLKRTDLEKDRVLVELNLDGGSMLATRADPLAVTLTGSLAAGGLGKHSADDLQTLLAGHVASAGFAAGPETFVSTAQTSPADLALQLRLMTAFVTDPGYRPEGEIEFRAGVANWFAALRATPAGALSADLGGILSDQEPRFSMQPQPAYAALSYARLRKVIADRLAHGAIEIGVVGDIDEAATIDLVARTLGALPSREAEFRAYPAQRERPFTQDHGPRTVTHTGPADQALLYMTWLTRDDTDPVEKQTLNLLDRVTRLALTETLRQRLGKAYGPSASSDPSRIWKNYGTFSINASIDVRDLPATRAAVLDTVAGLRASPVADDVLLRARAPLAEAFENQLKTDAGWLGLVARAQSQPDRIERQVLAEARLAAITPAQVQAAAQQYLTPERLVEIDVVPRTTPAIPSTGTATPAPAASGGKS